MTIDDNFKDETIQYGINREAAKTSPLSPGQIDKYVYLLGEEILPTDQSRITEETMFTYSPLSKSFGKKIKAIEKPWKKRVEVLEVLKPNVQKLTIKDLITETTLTKEAKNKLNKIKEKENMVERSNVIEQISIHKVLKNFEQ